MSSLKDSLKKKVKGPSAIDVLTSPIAGKSDLRENNKDVELQDLQSKHSLQENIELQSKQDLPDNTELQSKQSNNSLPSKQGLHDKQSLLSKHSKPVKQSKRDKHSKPGKVTSGNGLSDGWIRATFIMREDNLEKVKDFAYWERLQIKEVVDEALENYFLDKKVRKRPEKRGG